MRKRGFMIWGLACLVISIAGFWPTYFAPIIAGTYTDAVPLMPWHVLGMGLWVVLIASQPALVAIGRTDLHRSIGVFGAVVALGVVITGTIVQLDAMALHAGLDNTGDAVITPFFRLVTLLVFAVCVIAALVRWNRSDWHKRLMLLGTFSLLEAPLSRFYSNVLGLGDNSGLLAAVSHAVLMIIFLIWDRRTLGRFHPVTLWGTILITLIIFGTAPIAFSAWWADVAATLAATAN